MQTKKVKLCAFGARYTHSNLALHCLRAAVTFDIEIVEANINQRLEHVVENLATGQPDAIGFSCYIWSIDSVLRAASSLKKILPNCFIFLGGPEVSFNGEHLMRQNDFIDMIIRGCGEVPFAHFMRKFNENKSIIDTPSAIMRSGGDIITTPMAPAFDMNELPFVYNDLSAFNNKNIYYETSRGCPYRCAYCMSAGESSCLLDIERVKQEFEAFIRANVRQVKLVDRTFNYPAQRAYELFETLIALSEKYPQSTTNFHFEISAVLLTNKVLLLLKKAKKGLIQLEIGVQTTNRESLGAINRKHDTQKLISNTKALCAFDNIHVHVDLIAGLPFEDYASFAKSFDDVYTLGADHVQLGFLKILKGSPMFDMTEQYGIKYTDNPPYEVLCTHVMTYEEIRNLHRIAELVNTMHNSGNYRETLKLVTAKAPFNFFYKFSAFAQKNGYFDRPQSKHVLYELLLRFTNEDVKTKEALIYDWLSLEKPKGWPKGLLPKQLDKKTLHTFYNNYINLKHYENLTLGEKSRRSFIHTFQHLFESETTLLFDYSRPGQVDIHKISI